MNSEFFLFTSALGLKAPLSVTNVIFDDNQELHIHIGYEKGSKFECPCCSELCGCYDSKDKKWRHLNFFQYKAFIHFKTPRVQCIEHGVNQIDIPWAKSSIGFTLLFEGFVMALVKSGLSFSKVAKIVGISDKSVFSIIKRNVTQALKDKTYKNIKRICIDETSSKKGHNYVTVFADLDTKDVIFTCEGKDHKTVEKFTDFAKGKGIDTKLIQEANIDMSPAFIKGVKEFFPDSLIVFDKFHIIKLVSEALDKVRRRETKSNPLLNGSRYSLLKNKANLTSKQNTILENISSLNCQTIRAYNIKLTFQDILSSSQTKNEAQILLKKWTGWCDRSRIPEMRKLSISIKKHMGGILNYFTSRGTSAFLESTNCKIQNIKRIGRGFRNIENFKILIYLSCSTLEFDLPTQ